MNYRTVSSFPLIYKNINLDLSASRDNRSKYDVSYIFTDESHLPREAFSESHFHQYLSFSIFYFTTIWRKYSFMTRSNRVNLISWPPILLALFGPLSSHSSFKVNWLIASHKLISVKKNTMNYNHELPSTFPVKHAHFETRSFMWICITFMYQVPSFQRRVVAGQGNWPGIDVWDNSE